MQIKSLIAGEKFYTSIIKDDFLFSISINFKTFYKVQDQLSTEVSLWDKTVG